MSITEKLKSLNLSDDAIVFLKYEEGTDVLHYNETEIETALSETSVVSEFASLVAQSGLDARTRWHGNILEHLRSEDYLEVVKKCKFIFNSLVTYFHFYFAYFFFIF